MNDDNNSTITMNIVRFIWLCIVTVALCIVWFSYADANANAPTHNECVSYWIHRTASWQHAPTPERIASDAKFCGNVA